MTESDLRAMELHDIVKIQRAVIVRVVNGWIYIFRTEKSQALTSTFVKE
jgi:hypothetical protein